MLGLLLVIHEDGDTKATCAFGRSDDANVESYRVTESVRDNVNETDLKIQHFATETPTHRCR